MGITGGDQRWGAERKTNLGCRSDMSSEEAVFAGEIIPTHVSLCQNTTKKKYGTDNGISVCKVRYRCIKATIIQSIG